MGMSQMMVPRTGNENVVVAPPEGMPKMEEPNTTPAQPEMPQPESQQMPMNPNVPGHLPPQPQTQAPGQPMMHPSVPISGFMNPGQKTGQKRPFEEAVPPGPQDGSFPGHQSGLPPAKNPRLAGAPLVPQASQAPSGPPPAQHIDKDLKNAALRYLNKVKNRFENQKDVYNDFLDIMKEFQSRQLDTPGVIQKVSTLFMGETELILGFNDFLPDGYKITERDIAMHYPPKIQPKPKPKAPPRSQTNMKTPPELRYAQSYVSKIRKRFRNDREVYKKFLKLLQNYQEDQKSVKEVHDRVKELFKGHPDLLIEFKQFLPDPPDADGPAQPKSRKAAAKKPRNSHRDAGDDSQLKYKDEMEFFSQFKARMEPQQWEDFLKLVNLFNNHILSAMELMLVLRDLFAKPTRIPNRTGRGNKEDPGLEQPDLHNSLHKFVQMLCGGYVSVFEGKKAAPKGLHRPTQTVAGPSYMCRPQTTLPICSSRDDLCSAVLNDQYSLNPLGSEQTAVLTNTHEMALFKAEDERFELEMMVDRVEWAINKLEPIAEELSTLSRTEKQRYEVYDRLNVIVLRTIQRLYGEHGHEVIDWLYDQPGAAVPIILARLKQREGELRSIQHEQHKIWVDVYEKNYHKALDHRSYAFKTHDKKAIHTKALVQALKEGPCVHVYPTRHTCDEIGLKYVLQEIIKDIAGDDATAITELWDDWLAPHLFPPKDASAKPTKTRGQQQHGPKGMWILYGNQNMVSVFRLHQLLHSRMSDAKTMASEQDLVVQKEIDSSGQPATPRLSGEAPTNGVDPVTVCATPKVRHTGDPFQAFLSILLAMLRGQVDISKYEDECRTLLGTYSYKLFTLDKLIPRFIKESTALVQSEHWQTMKKGAEQVESGALKPEEFQSQMQQLFWHHCFELEYTIATSTMKISAVPMNESKDISALTVAAADILAANEDEMDAKESGLDDDEESPGNESEQVVAEEENAEEMEVDEAAEGSEEEENDEEDGGAKGAMEGILGMADAKAREDEQSALESSEAAGKPSDGAESE